MVWIGGIPWSSSSSGVWTLQDNFKKLYLMLILKILLSQEPLNMSRYLQSLYHLFHPERLKLLIYLYSFSQKSSWKYLKILNKKNRKNNLRYNLVLFRFWKYLIFSSLKNSSESYRLYIFANFYIIEVGKNVLSTWF